MCVSANAQSWPFFRTSQVKLLGKVFFIEVFGDGYKVYLARESLKRCGKE